MNTYRNSFIHTIKEAPNDAEVISHQLMIRSGMIRKVASGIYSILPLGQRVFSKLNAIIREEMNRIGAVECDMPHMVPSELWKTSGRWNAYGKELLRITDRHDREFCFGPTHEEVITDLVSFYTKSYKQLPVFLYQIQTKFRDEVRPRFGLMRGREFLMKDAYSFHESRASLDDCYHQSKAAYGAIFTRCGLQFVEANADSGAIGGDESVEFLVVAESGEDEVLVCESAGYAANVEAAPCQQNQFNFETSVHEVPAFKVVDTPKARTIDEVVEFFDSPDVTPATVLKSILVMTNDSPIMCCLAGDKPLNETKLTKVLGAPFRFATDDEVRAHCGASPGFIGPVGLPANIPIYLDYSLAQSLTYVCGANQNNRHLTSVSIVRDVKLATTNSVMVDIRNAQVGDVYESPTGDQRGTYTSQRGIEVGHVFKLGTKYSHAMGACFTNQQGKLTDFEMGCYGIGVGRTIAAAIEQSHDEHGIIWPKELAPYDALIINLTPKDPHVCDAVKTVHDFLLGHGLDDIVDDRADSPGVKFKDADLIGIPRQIIVGKHGLSSNHIELKHRRTGEKVMVPFDSLDTILN